MTLSDAIENDHVYVQHKYDELHDPEIGCFNDLVARGTYDPDAEELTVAGFA